MYPRGMQPLFILKKFLCLFGTLRIRSDETLPGIVMTSWACVDNDKERLESSAVIDCMVPDAMHSPA